MVHIFATSLTQAKLPVLVKPGNSQMTRLINAGHQTPLPAIISGIQMDSESSTGLDQIENKTKRGQRKADLADRVVASVPLRFLLLLACLVVIELIYMMIIEPAVHEHMSPFMQGTLNAVITGGILSLPLWFGIVKPMLAALKKDKVLLTRQQEALENEMQRHALNNQLAKAFGMAESESEINNVFIRAMKKIYPDIDVELLLADSSQAHMRLAASTAIEVVKKRKKNGDASADGGTEKQKTIHQNKDGVICNVGSPRECMATRSGKSQIHEDSQALDACPILVERHHESMSAVCVPINIAGQTVGVIHSELKGNGHNLDSVASIFAILSSHMGNRLGLVRAMSAAQQAAMTDPLTGLLNRRSLDDKCEQLEIGGKKFSVVVTDIDHFKKLNDTYSHAVGDRCLKAFSGILEKACRSNDIVARLGGEEFCIVLVDTEADKAKEILERVRAMLPKVLLRAGLPEFTASFGVTDTAFGDSLEELIKIADSAMYDAKQSGRDRIVVASVESKSKSKKQSEKTASQNIDPPA